MSYVGLSYAGMSCDGIGGGVLDFDGSVDLQGFVLLCSETGEVYSDSQGALVEVLNFGLCLPCVVGRTMKNPWVSLSATGGEPDLTKGT